MSDSPLFAAVDAYLEETFLGQDSVLDQVLESSQAAGMPDIQVSALQGRFLMLMARLTGAERILEIGTLAGYSTIWLARGLKPGGQVTTLELRQNQVELSEKHFEIAGVVDRIRCVQGEAVRTLPRLADEPPFDLIFIDADKPNYPAYLDWSIKLARPGALIITDNVVRAGNVLDPDGAPNQIEQDNAHAVRDFNALLAKDDRVEAVAMQQIGAKGHDGFALAVVK
ncbi:MAG: O-methyltransferase [Alphaproteobacteria bacterium]|nr:O-methyltransferase [Alphaproteobacteria bacterium SS10]